ncbi:TIGR03808 family TAT-translocated repetitive protein [Hyphomicrobium sp.]|uniref:TIGR03808 family TAT-translocated repetitive protein n=1 Tax=Hyphomicrobium sp. TaxID=82 RepID=UPI003F6F56FC
MPLDRRTLISTGLVSAGLATAAAAAGPRERVPASQPSLDFTLSPDGHGDQTARLQAAIDDAARRGAPLMLGAGLFRVGHITLRPNTRLIGAARQSVLEFTGGVAFITANEAPGVRLESLVVDGSLLGMDAALGTGLISIFNSDGISLVDLDVRRGLMNGIALTECSGRIGDCEVRDMSQAGIFSLDARGLDVAHNAVVDCGNNGIQIWRSAAGEDGTTVVGNRIARIAAKAGGTGQNGNGINVFRAGGVLAASNRIEACAYSAIRGNSAENIQMVGNACRKLGEVALYAEFSFSGALIASNVIDEAANGIAVTNFNEGGRLAVVQGNLVRNLFRREQEPVDKRGIGIGIEADAAVTGNVVEDAPTAGISAGWGPHLRDVAITGNVIRKAGIGIMVSSDPKAGACLISQNMISNTRDGAIRAMDHGQPHGPDLASTDAPSGSRLVISGNLAV